MVTNPFEEIVKLLKQNAVEFETFNHEAVYTSEQAARTRGESLHSGAKSLILKAGDEFVMAILPGDLKLDSKKLKQILGIKDLRFARPEEVKELVGCEIGAVYPFGSIPGIKMVVDKRLGESEVIFFNPGLHDRTIKMRYEDYIKVTKPMIVEITA